MPDAVPDGDTTLTTDKGFITSAEPGQEIVVLGFGFAPFSTAKVVIYSTPTVLATVTTDENGNFSAPVTIPTGLAASEHTFVALGTDPQGEERTLTLPVTVAAAGSGGTGSGSGSGSDPGKGDLPKTGAPSGLLWFVATGFAVTGGPLLQLSGVSRRRSGSA